jgi:hypothetical protein
MSAPAAASTQPAPTAAEFAAADEIRRCLELDGHKWTDKARDDWARIIAANRVPAEHDTERLKDMVIELARVFSEHGEQCRKEAETLFDGWAATHANGRGHAYEQAAEKLHAALAAQEPTPANTLSRHEMLHMVSAMRRYGGGFVVALSECFILADKNNLDRLYRAFPGYVAQYLDMAREDGRRSMP